MMESPENIVVENVIEKNDNFGALTVDFQHASLIPEETGQLKFKCYEEELSGDTKKNILVTSCGKRTYVGHEVEGGNSRKFLAFRNRATNKVTLVERTHFQLLPDIAYLGAVSSRDVVQGKQMEETDYQTARKKLTMEFGHIRNIRQAQQELRNKVDEEIIESSYGAMASNVENSTELDEIHTDSSSYLVGGWVPPMNRETEDITQVFDIRDFIDVDHLTTALGKLANKIVKSPETTEFLPFDKYTDTEETKFSDYFQVALRSLKTRKDDVLQDMAILLYMEGLICILNASCKTIKKTQNENNLLPTCFPARLYKQFLKFQNLAHKRHRLMKKTCAIIQCHFLILALLHGNFEVNLSLVASSTGYFRLNSLRILARLVGMTLHMDKNEVFGRLSLPLPALPDGKKNSLGIMKKYMRN